MRGQWSDWTLHHKGAMKWLNIVLTHLKKTHSWWRWCGGHNFNNGFNTDGCLFSGQLS